VSTEQRLDSWKEIAAYLRRGVRTAQRWERDAGLPVRRVGGDRQAVYAFRGELDDWWRGRTAQGPAGAAAAAAPAVPPPPVARKTRVRPFLTTDVAVDTESAADHASMAAYFFTLVAMGLSRPDEGLPAARAAAERALDLDDANLEALAVRAVLSAHVDRDWHRAAQDFALALERPPVPPLVRFFFACWYLGPLGSHDESLRQLTAALSDDPVYLIGRVQVGVELIDLGRHADGMRELEAVLGIDPQFGPALGHRGRELAIAGRVQDALRLAESTFAALPRHPNAVGFLAGMLHLAGEGQQGDAMLEQLSRSAPWAVPRALAESLAVRQRWDDALEALKGAATQKDPGLWILMSGTAGRRLRATSGWPSLAATLRLPKKVDVRHVGELDT
jgi:tetratricopeptide (TPR) repeat protein